MNKSNPNTVLLAEKMYVYEGDSLQHIADTAGKSEKTIRNWKNKYDWEKKRLEYQESIENLPTQLYDDYQMIMGIIRADIEGKRKPSASMINLAFKLFDRIPEAKQVETAAGANEETGSLSHEEMKNVLRQVVREELGLE